MADSAGHAAEERLPVKTSPGEGEVGEDFGELGGCGCSAHGEVRFASAFAAQLGGEVSEEVSGFEAFLNGFGGADADEGGFFSGLGEEEGGGGGGAFVGLGGEGAEVVGVEVFEEGLDVAYGVSLGGGFDEFVGLGGLAFLLVGA